MVHVLAVLLLLAQDVAAAKPEAMLNFERARSQLRTGSVRCVVWGGPRIIAMPTVQFTQQMAKNGDIRYSYDGDLEGVHGRDLSGYPMQVGGTEVLIKRDVVFGIDTFDPTVGIGPMKTRPPARLPLIDDFVDFRTIGMAPTWDSLVGQDARSVLSDATKGCTGYSVEREGTLHRVSVHFPDDREMVYEIDEAKGWNATRIAGKSAYGEWECVSDLSESAGVWFPRVVTLYQNGEPRTEWLITEASFNSPNDPGEWEPADIGCEVGFDVMLFGTSGGGRGLVWDGQKAVPREEFQKRLKAGELKLGPTMQQLKSGTWQDPRAELLERLRSSPRVLESFMSAWEYHVVQFCGLHRLNVEQRSRAYKCLRRAQERGNQYLSRSREHFKELQEKRDSGKLSPEQVQEQFLKLRKPVDDIFENQLKPCLEKIPTPKQRKEAESRKKERHEKLEVRPPAPVKPGQPRRP